MVLAPTSSILASPPFCVARVPTDRSLAMKGLSRQASSRITRRRLIDCSAARAKTLRGADRGVGALSDFGACLETLRRTGQSECELPHILWPCAALLSMARSLPGPSMPRLSFRPSRGIVGSACGCCHYMTFSDARSAPADLSIRAQRNDDPSRETRGPSIRQDGQFSAMEPRPRGSRHETSAAKRSARKSAKAHAWS
jgi:hypothetical protein